MHASGDSNETLVSFEFRLQTGTTYSLIGSLDAQTTPTFESEVRKLLDAGQHTFTFDCGGLHFLSSAGMSALAILQDLASQRGGGVSLTNVDEPIYEIFQQMGFDTLFQITKKP